jgi:hypothetical protein
MKAEMSTERWVSSRSTVWRHNPEDLGMDFIGSCWSLMAGFDIGGFEVSL